MWRYQEFLYALPNLIFVDCIKEIIVINNDKSRTPDASCLTHPKVKMHTPESNIYVVPSWNYGAYHASNEWMCFLSDDLNFDARLFYKLKNFIETSENSSEIGMIGLLTPYHDDPTYNRLFKDGEIDIVYCNDPDPNKRPSTTGMGNLFFVNKKDWKDIPNLKIFHGELLQWQRIYKYKKNYMITNCRAETPWHVTWKSLADDYSIREEIERIQITDQQIAESMNFTFE